MGNSQRTDRVQVVLDRLQHVRRSGDGWSARCPAHDDKNPSLTVKVGKTGGILVTCHSAKCTFEEIVAAVGLDRSDFAPPGERNGRRATMRPSDPNSWPVVATYTYLDPDGRPVFQVRRKESPDPAPPGTKRPKTFPTYRPDGAEWVAGGVGPEQRVLYHLPDVIDAIAQDRTVFVVEGEKKVERLAGQGYTATCNVGGAEKWSESYSRVLAGANVVILPDNDEPGRSHAYQVAASLTAARATVRIIELPGLRAKEDICDWLDGGHTLEELDAIIAPVRPWAPDPAKRRRWRLDDILASDAIMRPPPPIVPYLAWGARSTLFASAEKTGKSTIGRFIAAQVTLGGGFLGEPCAVGTVLWVGLEEAMSHFAREIRRFHPDAARVEYMDRMGLPGDPMERLSVLREEIGTMRPTLTVLDTLISWGEGAVTDMSASAQTAPIVNALTTLAHETGTALVLFHHARRSDGRYRDSSAIGGAVDSIVEMFVPDEDKDPTLRSLRVRGRMGFSSVRFRFDGDTYILDSGDTAPLDYRIREFVRTNSRCSVNDVVGALTGRRETIACAVGQMVTDGRLVNVTPGRQQKTLCLPGSQVELLE